MSGELLIRGAWKLVSMETRSVTGHVYPGLYDDGYLLYTDDGYMSAVLTKGRRSRFTNESLMRGSVEEKADAFDTYLSYGGRFSIAGDVVTHHVLFSLFPNWVGGDQIRRFALDADGDMLTIRTVNPTLINDEETHSYFIWRRA